MQPPNFARDTAKSGNGDYPNRHGGSVNRLYLRAPCSLLPAPRFYQMFTRLSAARTIGDPSGMLNAF
jgi:hypothetical protein